MDPIAPLTALMDKAEELIGHSPHPAVVGLPIGAWTVSNICDGLAIATGNDRYDDVARVSMAIGLAGAAVAIVTGLRDYSHIERSKPSHEIATTHAIGNAVASSLIASSYVLRVREHQRGERTGHLARLLALAGGGLSMYTAWLGGVLVQEYGEAVKPVIEEEKRREQSPGRERLSSQSPYGSGQA